MKRVMLTRPVRNSSSTSYTRASRDKAATLQSLPQNPRGKPGPLSILSIDRDRGSPPGALHPVTGNEIQHKDLEELVKLTEALTPTERKQLLARLSLAAQDQNTRQLRDLDMWATAVWEGLLAANGMGEGAGQGPLLVKRALAGSAWGPVEGFMEDSGFMDLKVVERQSLYRMLAKLVIEKAQYISRKSGAPLSAKLVANTSSNIASIFDQHFPGYLASGLGRFVAKALLRQEPSH